MKIYLIPSPLAPETPHYTPAVVLESLKLCRYFLVEDIRTTRRWIASLKLGIVIDELQFFVLNKNTQAQELTTYFKEIPPDACVGVVSEAGCPAIADPGSLAVAFAHRKGYQVIPLVGGSSIFLALMASGFNGQRFAFHGYLPIDSAERQKAVKNLEREMQTKQQTQLFIETPYRNNALLRDMLACLSPQTMLCVAKNLTASDEWVKTLPVGTWKTQILDLHKQHCIFLLGK